MAAFTPCIARFARLPLMFTCTVRVNTVPDCTQPGSPRLGRWSSVIMVVGAALISHAPGRHYLNSKGGARNREMPHTAVLSAAEYGLVVTVANRAAAWATRCHPEIQK